MTPPGERGAPLRQVALTGGAYLVFREALGILIRLGGVVAVTRLIGPSDYGVFVAASAFVTLAATLAQGGAEVWLIKKQETPTAEDYDATFSFLLVVSLVVVVVGIAGSFPVALWYHDHAALVAFRILMLSVPVNILWAPAQAKIERTFDYRKMAWLELSGDVALYGVAVPLAFLHLGVLAPVIGFVAWQATLLVGSLVLSGLRPRWRWSGPMARELLRHGAAYSSSTWIGSLASLANPIIVGGFLGSAAVAYVGLAVRLVETAGFAFRAAWRLGLATISRLADQPARLRVAMEEGMFVQTVIIGLPMGALAVVSPWAIPLVFGHEWRPVIPLFGVLAFSRLLGCAAQLQMTYLLATNRNAVVARAVACNLVLTAALGVTLVPFLGDIGFAWANLVGTGAWLLLDREARPAVGFSYRLAALTVAALAPATFSAFVPMPWKVALLLPVPLLVALPSLRSTLFGYAKTVSGALPLVNRLAGRSVHGPGSGPDLPGGPLVLPEKRPGGPPAPATPT